MSMSTSATNYYINPKGGNDTNNGRSREAAWASARPLQGKVLQPGDSVLFKGGTVLDDVVELCGRGTVNAPVIVDCYDAQDKACIAAPDSSRYAMLISNSDYVYVRNLELTNLGSVEMPGRTGIKVSCADYGVSHDIRLSGLYIHDVNGSLIKKRGGGAGILIETKGDKKPSAFDGMLVADCIVRRCQRNAIICNAPWDRSAPSWKPNRNVVVRGNLIEEVPGDGIVTIGCDGALIEYNIMRKCPATIPSAHDSAAGFWPWSCDNTVIRFNEVCDLKAPWDAQAYDCDDNCIGTVIEYNYSHDCDGGLVLVCEDGDASGVGCQRSVIRNNVSVNDAVRPRATRAGIFAPTIHIAGPVSETTIEENLIFVGPKPEPFCHRNLITSDEYSGYASDTRFVRNVFVVAEPSSVNMTKSTGNVYTDNLVVGAPVKDLPATHLSDLPDITSGNGQPSPLLLEKIMQHRPIANGAAVITTVDPGAIHALFSDIFPDK